MFVGNPLPFLVVGRVGESVAVVAVGMDWEKPLVIVTGQLVSGDRPEGRSASALGPFRRVDLPVTTPLANGIRPFIEERGYLIHAVRLAGWDRSGRDRLEM